MKPIIEVDDVSFSYGSSDSYALRHVTLDVAQGSFVGIIGPSGAGKSTLAACLSGAVPHHYAGKLFGAVRVKGQDTCEISLTDISQIVGSVLQDIDAQMVASVVEDEMLFGLENFGAPHDQIEQRIASTLETVGISDLREREIATLSGGQKQKVAIAAILALAPDVLVLDEPTAALDPASSTLVFDTLRQINRKHGITIVVIEQKVALLSTYCDRIAVLDKGSVAYEGTPHEVFAHAEELRRIGVDSPRVARISNSLAADGIIEAGTPCLNVDETADLIDGLVKNRGGSAQGTDTTQGARGKGREGACDITGAPACHRTPSPSPHAPTRPKAQDAEPLLVFDHVDFAYPAGGATVRDLNLTVYPGELVALVGQNGAGKTTLTKLLTGLLKPASGSVTVAGLDTREVPTSRIARQVSTLFQDPDRQICKETVRDEVAFGLELAGATREEALERADAVIARFGLPADEAPFSLSRGQRQLVALASVIAVEPRIIVLDEPTSGLDYRECMTVMETVRSAAEKGCAVIMVCHDMEVVSDFAERIAVMADGRILDRGVSSELFANRDLMERAFVEPPQVIALSQKLAQRVSPAFAGISEVSDIVRVTEELIDRG